MQPCHKKRLIMGFSCSRFANRSNWLQSKYKAVLQAVVPREDSKAGAHQQFLLAIAHKGVRYSVHLQTGPWRSVSLRLHSASLLSVHSEISSLLCYCNPQNKQVAIRKKRNASADETSGLECDLFTAEGTGKAAADHQPHETCSTMNVGDRITIPPLVSFGVMFWPLPSVNTMIQHERFVPSLKACRLPFAGNYHAGTTLPLTQFSPEQRDWGNGGEGVHRSLLQLGVQGMLEEMLRADKAPKWWKAGDFGDVLQSMGGRRRLCRMTSGLLHTSYTGKANKVTWLGNDWSMPKLWTAALDPVS